MKRLLGSIAVLLLMSTAAAGDWPPSGWSGGNSAASSARGNPAVVRIVAPGRESVSYGSGSLVAKSQRHGLIITNWHVINEATGQITVNFPDGFQSAATVIKIDRDWDLAALAIWRPNTEPIPLAGAAPQPGEMLTIAGYGSGSFRTASGRCTQYVAPGTSFPFEMVELATTARQGDSGGPILNSRGELAGVLFGEGGGRTAGSYCGRVQWFLDGLLPAQNFNTPSTMLAGAAQPSAPPVSPPVAPGQSGARVASLAALGTGGNQMAQATPPPPRAMAPPSNLANGRTTNFGNAGGQTGGGWQNAAPRGLANSDRDPFARRRDLDQSEMASVPKMRAIPDTAALGQMAESRTYPASGLADSNAASSAGQRTLPFGWTDIAGNTLGEQCKSVLATIGGMAVMFRTIGWFARGKSSSDSETDEDEDDDEDDDDDDDDD